MRSLALAHAHLTLHISHLRFSHAAYIVVGWLPDDTEESDAAQRETRHCCMNMLLVADSVLAALEKLRETTGVDLHGRIGVATGRTISGVLGRLQPRFCVFGEAMSKAAQLEATGTKDAVHCSKEFFDFIVHGGSLDRRHSNAFSADLAFQQQRGEIRRTVLKRPNNRLRTVTSALKANRVIEKMVKEGKFIVQQNMMDAAPTAEISYRPNLLRRRIIPNACSADNPMVGEAGGSIGVGGSIMDHLGRSIDCDGNFLWWSHHTMGMLRKQIDEFGTLQSFTIPS